MLKFRSQNVGPVEWIIVSPDDTNREGHLLRRVSDNNRNVCYFTVRTGKFISYGTTVNQYVVPESFGLEPHHVAFYTYWMYLWRSGNITHSHDLAEVYCGDWVVSTCRIQYQGMDIQSVCPFTIVKYGIGHFPRCRIDAIGTRCDLECLVAVSMAVNGGHLVY